ncbi:MAG TPA: hypothetical protein DCG39_01145 [Opitutae bacterium]|nr:hypothetical protein [Opitutae bacterium]
MKILSFILLLALAGCVPKPFVFKPENDLVPSRWETRARQAQEGNSTFWIESFGDDALKQAILAAWRNNPDLLATAERVLASGEEAVIAGASLFPAARADVSGTRSKRNLIGFNFPGGETSFTTKSFSSGINLSWELDFWGRIRDLRHSARKRFEGSQADYEAARLSLAGQVAKGWFALAESSAQLGILRKTTETYSKNQAYVSDRFDRGLQPSRLEKDLATSILANARANLAKGRLIHEANLRALCLLLGEYPSIDRDRNESRPLPLLSLPPRPPTPTETLARRPDLRAARMNMEASGFDLKASGKSLLPSFSILGGPGSRAGEFNDLLDERFRTWEVAGSVSQSIFQGGRLMAGTRRAKAIQKGAVENYKSAILKAFAEVENALSAENLLVQEEQSLELAVQASTSAAQISWERYQRGVENIFNALENQRRSFEAESRLLSVKKERIHNRINLYLALGLDALPEKQ